MRAPLVAVCFMLLLGTSGCREHNLTKDTSEATIASETGGFRPLPSDVMLLTKAIVDGELYSRPSFNGISVARFDTSHQIQVLDTSDQLFVKARVIKDTTAFMGYVSKAILPE